jgi:hypothetical protein
MVRLACPNPNPNPNPNPTMEPCARVRIGHRLACPKQRTTHTTRCIEILTSSSPPPPSPPHYMPCPAFVKRIARHRVRRNLEGRKGMADRPPCSTSSAERWCLESLTAYVLCTLVDVRFSLSARKCVQKWRWWWWRSNCGRAARLGKQKPYCRHFWPWYVFENKNYNDPTSFLGSL